MSLDFSQILAPSLNEISIAEIDGKILNLGSSKDQKNLSQYVNSEGIVFPNLQIPYQLSHPDLVHLGTRRVVTDLPISPTAYGRFMDSMKRSIDEQLNQTQTYIQEITQNIRNILPSFLNEYIFNADTEEYMQSLRMKIDRYPAKIIDWHPYFSIFAVVHRVDVIFLYDLRVEGWFPEVLENSLQKEITCMAWKPLGGNILAVGCRSGICLWELSLEQKKESVPTRLHSWMLQSLTCDITSLATGSADGSIILWDTALETGIPLTRSRKVTFLSWSPVGEFLFSSSLDGKIEMWETQRWTSKTITSNGYPIETGCWTTDGRALFLGFNGREGEIHVLSVSPNFDYEWLPKIDLSPIPECAGIGIEQLAIDPNGERLVVCFKDTRLFKDTELLVVFDAKLPSQVSKKANLLNFPRTMRGPAWSDPDDQGAFFAQADPKPISLSFAKQFTRGSLLSTVWEDGQISFIPFLYSKVNK
ncbi:WD40-repeat-containing domain protein [Glomus cerebriforme]|uniref:WD40-repeat-containing domain protein n=1 Tax=Glomus cerebriforme TaxID=658196 RepID=A0A397TMS8_9GLOM|nr:WD40-repeat-containing domain protein [Glomus cerebriforme]